ncbi:D-tagatose-bisphosphate aldolase, class II, non-catalytic subunit [Thioclava atlantica]|uniref:Tagatose-6-phosphate kinase n=1 Tax=Thioclava atlantica TaxID=1317124 RepID=A0A085TT11_9RHOB|nr:D-tagatose-bisphosphate aldolase, class II, non-catalytic subunit [Thioclava atlantica]KFE33858.1 tagatose-6-phosphate kinase [Thioclava atlantica]
MTKHVLADIAKWRERSGPSGIPSICSAHPVVLEAAMRSVLPSALPLLVEATCNQVNQEGGYTGMTPDDFRAFVERIAAEVGFPLDRLVLGGDHLGPNPWKALPASEAMDKAEAMIRAYVAAGFTKLHLDCSMGCAGEPVALGDEETAARAARLAVAAEASVREGQSPPVYIVGTEVPVPGGAMSELDELEVTQAQAASKTYEVTRSAFLSAGQSDAFERVIGIVVQPGVEFGNHNVVDYDHARTDELRASLKEMPGLVFECHSTDYQTRDNLKQLVQDGFAILKVGPGLTFRLREALYGLDEIASRLFPGKRAETLKETMERLMLAAPQHWEKYYPGSAEEQALQRHFSYSDRIRYYWPQAEAARAVDELMGIFDGVEIPETLIGQYLGARYEEVRAGELKAEARSLVLAAVSDMVQDYISGCE